jgi:hypothetical protein
MEMKLSQKKMDSDRTKQRMQEKIVSEKERVAREMRSRFLSEQSNLKVYLFIFLKITNSSQNPLCTD